MLIFCIQVLCPKRSPSSFWTSPNTQDQRAWPLETRGGKGSLESVGARAKQLNPEKGQSCSSCPYSKVTEGPGSTEVWQRRAINPGTKDNLEVASVTAARAINSLITKWGFDMNLLKHISTEKGRLERDCFLWAWHLICSAQQEKVCISVSLRVAWSTHREFQASQGYLVKSWLKKTK